MFSRETREAMANGLTKELRLAGKEYETVWGGVKDGTPVKNRSVPDIAATIDTPKSVPTKTNSDPYEDIQPVQEGEFNNRLENTIPSNIDKIIDDIDITRVTLDDLGRIRSENPNIDLADGFCRKLGPSYKSNPLRMEYETKVIGIAEEVKRYKAQGISNMEIAKRVSQTRRELGIKYKDATPPVLRDYIYKLNIDRYGDPLGPTFEWLLDGYDYDYEKIIAAASRPNSNIDKLLGGFQQWLTGKLN